MVLRNERFKVTNFLLQYQWHLFITIEISFILVFLLFGFVRYFLNKLRLSYILLAIFVFLILLEALLAFVVYRLTGEFSIFQLIIIIFVLYAVTFGIFDFLKLDRWMRQKVGTWRNVELLTEKDYERIRRSKDPKYLARLYRKTSTVHLIIFIVGQFILWYHGTSSIPDMFTYLADLSWIQTGNIDQSPYANESTYSIGMLWGLIFFIDFVWSWSYTFFPSKPK